MKLELKDILEAANGTLLCGVEPISPFTNVSIDSRTLEKGDLFLAIKGIRCDGHNFLNTAIDKGCGGCVVSHIDAALEKVFCEKKILTIKVNNTITALGEIASLWRSKNSARVITITGSNGKTTTKNMAAAILSNAMPVLSAPKNFNNNIGVPLTLLQIEPHHKFAVSNLE